MSSLFKATDRPAPAKGQKNGRAAARAGAIIGDFDPDEEYPEVHLGCGLTAQLAWVIPAFAEELLLTVNAEKQRRIKDRNKQTMIVDLKAGRWRLNGEPIIIDAEGRVIDGQHRLSVVVDTGVPIKSLIIRGVDPEAFSTIDAGSKRTGSDAFRSLGVANATALSAAAVLVYQHENGGLYRRLGASPATLAEVLARHPELEASVAFTRPCAKILRSAGVGGYCHYFFRRSSPKLADIFFEKLASGEELKGGDPVLALRTTLIQGYKFTTIDLAHRVIKAWNFSKTNRSCRLIKIHPGEILPEIN